MKKPDTENQRKIQYAESHRRILLAGMAVFAEKGYRGATVRDIVEKVGCSVNAISLHFGSKENLAVAIVEELKRTIVLPVANKAEEIFSDFAWRVAVKRYIKQLVDLFTAKDEPNCYFPDLYRHESANFNAKKVTLHEEIVQPLFHQLEGLVSLGVADRDLMTVRLTTLALWNMLIVYALKHPAVLAADIPVGIESGLFHDATIDFMVERGLSGLHFTPSISNPSLNTSAH